MTWFIRIENGEPSGNPIAEQNFRKIFPKTSFPKYFSNDVVEPLGYGIYEFATPPDCGVYEKCVPLPPIRSDSGIWRQAWQILEMSKSEKLDVDAILSREARRKRDYLLTETDWVVVFHTEKGSNIPLEWEVYRQALRDITSNVNFPHLAEEDWPVKP